MKNIEFIKFTLTILIQKINSKLFLVPYIHVSSLLSWLCSGVLALVDGSSNGLPLELTGDRSRIMLDPLDSPSQSVVEMSELTSTSFRCFFEGGTLSFLGLLTFESLFMSFLATCSCQEYIVKIKK